MTLRAGQVIAVEDQSLDKFALKHKGAAMSIILNRTYREKEPIYSTFGNDPDLSELIALFVSDLQDRIAKIDETFSSRKTGPACSASPINSRARPEVTVSIPFRACAVELGTRH